MMAIIGHALWLLGGLAEAKTWQEVNPMYEEKGTSSWEFLGRILLPLISVVRLRGWDMGSEAFELGSRGCAASWLCGSGRVMGLLRASVSTSFSGDTDTYLMA